MRKNEYLETCYIMCTHNADFAELSVLKYLPSWLGHLSEIWEVILNPRVNLFQCHPSVFAAIDGKLDHCHVGVWWPLRWVFFYFSLILLILCLCKNKRKQTGLNERFTDTDTGVK